VRSHLLPTYLAVRCAGHLTYQLEQMKPHWDANSDRSLRHVFQGAISSLERLEGTH